MENLNGFVDFKWTFLAVRGNCHLIAVITHSLSCKPLLVMPQCITSSDCLISQNAYSCHTKMFSLFNVIYCSEATKSQVKDYQNLETSLQSIKNN